VAAATGAFAGGECFEGVLDRVGDRDFRLDSLDVDGGSRSWVMVEKACSK
jgi:hypothetical protein